MSIRFQIRLAQRVTNMVDGIGTNKYTYHPGGQLYTDDLPPASGLRHAAGSAAKLAPGPGG